MDQILTPVQTLDRIEKSFQSEPLVSKQVQIPVQTLISKPMNEKAASSKEEDKTRNKKKYIFKPRMENVGSLPETIHIDSTPIISQSHPKKVTTPNQKEPQSNPVPMDIEPLQTMNIVEQNNVPQRNTTHHEKVQKQATQNSFSKDSLVPSFSLIVESDKRRLILQKYCQLLGIKNLENCHFAGPNPISLSHSHLNTITEKDYLITAKIDGVRYMFILMKIKSQNLALMIDRSMRIFEISVYCDESYFLDTLFDGELAWTNEKGGSLTYHVFDIMYHTGKCVMNLPLDKRIHIMCSCLPIHLNIDYNVHPMILANQYNTLAASGKIVFANNRNHMQIKLKEYYNLSSIHKIVDMMKIHQKIIDGIIFVPVKDGVYLRKAKTTYKFKTKHTIDFECKLEYKENQWFSGLFYCDDRNTNDEFVKNINMKDACLGVEYKGKTLQFLHTENNDIKRIKKSLLERNKTEIVFIGEFLITIEEDHIYAALYKLRLDKETPNSITTILRTLDSIFDTISLDQLCEKWAIPSQ